LNRNIKLILVGGLAYAHMPGNSSWGGAPADNASDNHQLLGIRATKELLYKLHHARALDGTFHLRAPGLPVRKWQEVAGEWSDNLAYTANSQGSPIRLAVDIIVSPLEQAFLWNIGGGKFSKIPSAVFVTKSPSTFADLMVSRIGHLEFSRYDISNPAIRSHGDTLFSAIPLLHASGEIESQSHQMQAHNNPRLFN